MHGVGRSGRQVSTSLSRDFSESRLHPYSALIASSEDILPTDLGNAVRCPCRFVFPCPAIAISWPPQRGGPATASIPIACTYGAIRKLRFSNSTRSGPGGAWRPFLHDRHFRDAWSFQPRRQEGRLGWLFTRGHLARAYRLFFAGAGGGSEGEGCC